MFAGKKLLITGGTGTFGHAVLDLKRLGETLIGFLAQFVGFLDRKDALVDELVDERVTGLSERAGGAGQRCRGQACPEDECFCHGCVCCSRLSALLIGRRCGVPMSVVQRSRDSLLGPKAPGAWRGRGGR